MKKFKIYFMDEEVAEFNEYNECLHYIKEMLENDEELNQCCFAIYEYKFF